MIPDSKLPALVAGGAGVLVLGIALGIWVARSGQSSAPGGETAPDAPLEEAAPAPRGEDAMPVELCGPLTEPRTEVYGRIRVEPSREDDQCTLHVLTTGGEDFGYESIAQSSGSWAAIDAQYADLDGDGVAELLLSGDSGGSGGFHDSWIVSQAPPRMIDLPSSCAAEVVEAPGGGRAVKTCNLGLEISGLDCNACRPKPRIYYRYANGEFTEANEPFVKEYDESIAFLARQLEADKLDAFVASKDAEDPAYDPITRQLVIHMAVDYVYSGRPEEARRTFEQMWPAWDRQAIIDEVIGTPPPAAN